MNAINMDRQSVVDELSHLLASTRTSLMVLNMSKKISARAGNASNFDEGSESLSERVKKIEEIFNRTVAGLYSHLQITYQIADITPLETLILMRHEYKGAYDPFEKGLLELSLHLSKYLDFEKKQNNSFDGMAQRFNELSL